MKCAFVILLLMALALIGAAWKKDPGLLPKGFRASWGMLLGLLPLLILAFLLAGLIQVAIPPEVIQTWLGEESGLRGIMLGTVVGALITGGPYLSFPIIAAVFQSGAGLGTTVALVTGWAMLGLGQLPFEATFLGPRFMLIRLLSVCLVPVLAGGIAQLFFGGGL